MASLHIKKQDNVVVLTGKDKGKTGRVLRVMANETRALVEGVNMLKRHTRANPQKNVKGGIVEREGPIHLSNLMVVCGECSRPARVSRKTLEDGRKVRACRRCGGILDKG